MRAVVQRVSRATVREVTTGEVLGSLGQNADGSSAVGLCVLLGVGQGDTKAEADWLADKVCGLRIFPDPDSDPALAPLPEPDSPSSPDLTKERAPKRLGNMNRALRDVGGALLVISQFTLYADTSRGRRPSFIDAMPPEQAQALYEYFVAALRGLGYRVATGRFGAMMAVELVNDGPVTLWLDTREASQRRDKSPKPASPPAGQGG